MRVRPARLTQSTTTTSNNTITIPLGEGLRNRPYSVDQFIPLSLPPFIASWSNTKGKGVAKKKKKRKKNVKKVKSQFWAYLKTKHGIQYR